LQYKIKGVGKVLILKVCICQLIVTMHTSGLHAHLHKTFSIINKQGCGLARKGQGNALIVRKSTGIDMKPVVLGFNF